MVRWMRVVNGGIRGVRSGWRIGRRGIGIRVMPGMRRRWIVGGVRREVRRIGDVRRGEARRRVR